MTAELIIRKAPEGLSQQTVTLSRSARRMASLLDSLLEYNRSVLGGGMTIQRRLVGLEAACREELELQRAADPRARLALVAEGDLTGEFDASRIREALGNLITNAIKHGVPGEPVIVRLEGDPAGVRLSVENTVRQEISTAEMEPLFEPLHRGAIQRPGSERTHLGLGLFIARQIARAHGGDVSGHCSALKVRFTIALPRTAAPA